MIILPNFARGRRWLVLRVIGCVGLPVFDFDWLFSFASFPVKAIRRQALHFGPRGDGEIPDPFLYRSFSRKARSIHNLLCRLYP